MKTIQAYIGKELVWFKEIESETKFKAGRLKIKDFFKWLEDKCNIDRELRVLILKGMFKQEVKIT
mgnify:CR=1 FL=1